MKIVVLDGTAVTDEGPGKPAYFSTGRIAYLRRQGHEVSILPGFDSAACSKADLVWTEWCNEVVFEAAASGVCKRLVLCMRGYDVWFPLELLNWKSVDALVCESPPLRNLFLSRFPLASVRIEVIPSGIDLSKFQFQERSPKNIIAMAARADYGKGFQLAVEWVRSRPDVELHVAIALPESNPRLMGYLKHAAPSNLHVHPPTFDVGAWFNKIGASYLLSCSLWETFGYSIAEGMACGLKPLVHDFPGARELWPTETVWRTFAELNALLLSPIKSQEYRAFIEEVCDGEKQSQKFSRLLMVIPARPVRENVEPVRLKTKHSAAFENALAILQSKDKAFTASAVQSLHGHERAYVELGLAILHYDADEFAEAETWALRSIRGAPRADTMCLLGEIMAAVGFVEAALGWYGAAQGIRYELSPSWVSELVARRKERFAELRQEANEMLRPVRFGAAVPSHALIVQTTRRPESYLQRLLASLSAAGLERWQGPKILVADGCAPTILGWQTYGSDEQVGQAQTFFKALDLAGAFEYVTFLEDDVVLARNALDYIKTVQFTADLKLVAWYGGGQSPFVSVPGPFLATVAASGFARIPAVTMPGKTAREVATSAARDAWKDRHGADEIFGRVFPDGLCAIHFPSVVQHIGDISAVGNTGSRPSPTFPGEDFDAGSLTEGGYVL